YHDSAACLVIDGKIVAAAQEERFTRKKHDSSFPAQAIGYCLREAGVTYHDLDYAAFYEKPFIKFERLVETYLAEAPSGVRSFILSMPVWLKKKLRIPDELRKQLPGFEGRILFIEHHEAHAASAFFASPFESAAILTVDGVGEWATTTIGQGQANRISLSREIKFPHSLGLLYSAFTYYTGFKVNSGEYKLMGLAPYGEPAYVSLIRENLIDIKEDGSFRLNMEFFNYCSGLTMTGDKFHKLFGGPPRKPESPLTSREMDIARSIQEVTEELMLKLAGHARAVTAQKKICLGGGVALNCVANGRILREGGFDDIWIQPAAGDSGGALGSALFVWHQLLGNKREADGRNDFQAGSCLGPSYDDGAIEAFLEENKIPHEKCSEEDIVRKTAGLVESQHVIGWFQGRMEFGPRALGSRSIIADARSPLMQQTLNLKIKFRESFRPFAPSVLYEMSNEWFELTPDDKKYPSPYMLLVAPVRPDRRKVIPGESAGLSGIAKLKVVRSEIPAVTHVDFSARVQTVHRETSPLFYRLIEEFHKNTGCPVIINTSFNVRGEPLVCTPQDAYRCFMRTEMDFLVLGNFLLDKQRQPAWQETSDWRREFELD
ncbi:MAG: carbamoyltransferase, partial [Nitrospirae bacterium]|nr:carbamoyltransferase [Nitrospirota bacterium]